MATVQKIYLGSKHTHTILNIWPSPRELWKANPHVAKNKQGFQPMDTAILLTPIITLYGHD